MTWLDRPVPWGRSMAEYRAMFHLDDVDPGSDILDVAAGPASFVAEWNDRAQRLKTGGQAVAIDPLYNHPPLEIARDVAMARDQVMPGVRAHPERYDWSSLPNPDALEQVRVASMERFLEDYRQPDSHRRYRVGVLPSLELPGRHFDLALCSHFLFLYADMLDEQFHLASIRRLIELAADVRIYPLLNLDNQRPGFLKRLIETLREADGLTVEEVPVSYRFQTGAHSMLRILR